MFDVKLFLGFPVDTLFESQLRKVHTNLISQFIGETEDYLKEATQNNMRFLGKEIGDITSLNQLELSEKNIYSLLNRLVPDFPYEETVLYLFPLEQPLS